MKKKSIFVVALAALMLIAFTACEQQMPTYKVPVGLTLTTTKTEYFTDEALDPSTFSGVVEYSDGSTQTLSGAELSLLERKGSGKISTISASYGSGNYIATASVEVARYDVDSIKLSNLPTTATEDEDGTAVVSTEGVAVTASYNGGKTRVLDADDYKLVVEFEMSSASADEDGLYTVANTNVVLNMFGGPNYSTSKISLDGDWKVDVDPYTEEFVAKDVNHYGVEYTVTRNGEVVEDPEMDNLYIGDRVAWTIYAYTGYDDSSSVTYTAKQEVKDYYIEDNVSTKSSYSIEYDTEESFNVIIANPTAAGAESRTVAVSIGSGTNTNYIEKIGSIKIDDTVAVGDPIEFSDLTINVVWADDTEGHIPVAGSGIEEGDVVIIDPTAKEGSATYRFLVTFDSNTTDPITQEVSVKFTAAADGE